MSKLSTVCFTGHRPEHLGLNEEQVKSMLRPVIQACINKGAVNFITGMQRGIDIWAGEVVVELAKQHPHVKLLACVPFQPAQFCGRWNKSDKARYSSLIKACAGIHYIQTEFSMSAYNERNRYMVDHSDLVIACWSGKQRGGTYNAVNYARKSNVPVVNVFKRV